VYTISIHSMLQEFR